MLLTLVFSLFAVMVVIAQSMIDILAAISEYFGLDLVSLLAIAAMITVAVNYLKVTAPFSNWIKDGIIPYVTGALALAVSASTMWGSWVQLFVSAALITVLSIGGWATMKLLAHKVGTKPTSKSGGK